MPTARIGAYGISRSRAASSPSKPSTKSAATSAGVATITASNRSSPASCSTRQPASAGSMRRTVTPRRKRSPKRSESRSVSVCIPPAAKLQRSEGLRGPFIRPRMIEPWAASSSRRRGKTAATLVCAASPPLMPSSAGETSRSATSRPKRRTANAYTLSSSFPAAPRPTMRSPSARTLPSGESSVIFSASGGFVGSL